MSAEARTREGDALAEVRGASKTFRTAGREVHAVKDVSFSIRPGETLGVIGESGSGKSTLGRLLLGLLNPDNGEVLYEGVPMRARNPRELRDMRSSLTVVFQEPYQQLNPRHRLFDIVAEPLVVQGQTNRADRRRRVLEVFDQVGLQASLGDRYPGQISGGQQQRVGIARAIVGAPRLIVLDEPTASLDRTIRAQISKLLLTLQQALDLSYLLITHDIGSVRALSDRTLVMYRGEMVELGDTSQVLGDPAHPYTRTLVNAELPARPKARQELHHVGTVGPSGPADAWLEGQSR